MTEYQLQLRREAATTEYEQLVAKLRKFLTGNPDEVVDYGNGKTSRTLAAIINDMEGLANNFNQHVNSANSFLDELSEVVAELPSKAQ
jgi:hypothetical protein